MKTKQIHRMLLQKELAVQRHDVMQLRHKIKLREAKLKQFKEALAIAEEHFYEIQNLIDKEADDAQPQPPVDDNPVA